MRNTPHMWTPTQPPRATLGKIGFWLLIGAFAVSALKAVWEYAALNSAVGDTGLSSNDPEYLDIVRVSSLIGYTAILAVIASTVCGIVSLVKKERPRWWGIVSTVSLPAYFIINAILQFLFAIVVIGVLAVGSSF